MFRLDAVFIKAKKHESFNPPYDLNISIGLNG